MIRGEVLVRRLAAAFLALLVVVASQGCSRPQVMHQEAYVFGTRVDLSVYGETAETAETAMAAVLREFDRLHRSYHAWEPSELTRLNEAIARGERIEVSDELAALLRDAQR